MFSHTSHTHTNKSKVKLYAVCLCCMCETDKTRQDKEIYTRMKISLFLFFYIVFSFHSCVCIMCCVVLCMHKNNNVIPWREIKRYSSNQPTKQAIQSNSSSSKQNQQYSVLWFRVSSHIHLFSIYNLQSTIHIQHSTSLQ